VEREGLQKTRVPLLAQLHKSGDKCAHTHSLSASANEDGTATAAAMSSISCGSNSGEIFPGKNVSFAGQPCMMRQEDVPLLFHKERMAESCDAE
jgi:hypothetical protein